MSRCRVVDNGSSSSSSTSDSDSSSSDGDGGGARRRKAIRHDRWVEADIRGGLQHSRLRLRALRELGALLATPGAYQAADKRAQAAVFEALLDAARLADDGRAAVRAARAAVLEAARRALPQQRRSALNGEAKRAELAAARQRRRRRRRHSGGSSNNNLDGKGANASDDDDGDGSSDDGGSAALPPARLSDVPDAVARAIFAALDPVSFGRAACACRAWRELAYSDAGLWEALARRVFGRRAANAAAAGGGADGDGRAQAPPPELAAFRALAAARPAYLLPWLSARAVVRGRLVWVPAPPDANGELPGAAAAAAAAAAGAAAAAAAGAAAAAAAASNGRARARRQRRDGAAAPRYPSVDQVVAWLLGGARLEGARGGRHAMMSSSGGSDSDGDGGSGSSSDDDKGGGGIAATAAAAAARRMRLWAI